MMLDLSRRIYRALLLAYPGDFRRAYGEEMVQVFSDLCRDVLDRQGTPGLVQLWMGTFIDLVLTALEERKRTMQPTERRLIALEFALLIAPLLFVTANVTHYELGFDGLYEVLNSAVGALHLDSLTLLRDLLVIPAPFLAVALLALHSAGVSVSRQGSTLAGTLTFRANAVTLAVLVVALILLTTITGYAFLENFAPRP